MPKSKILIIEDEPGLVQSLTWYFNREDYETHSAKDGTEGLRKAQAIVPDVILLDLMLPGMSGYDVCRQLKSGESTSGIPVIMLTARSEESDQIEGFSTGADDYVTKPFSNKVLLQRVKAIMRRNDTIPPVSDIMDHLGVRIDRVRHHVTFHEQPMDLTPTEFRLLECMLRQPGRAFTRLQLMDAAIGEGSIVLERTIDVHIKTLRKKLTDIEPTALDLIETVRSVGYRFRESLDPTEPKSGEE
ncbi:MAG: response regulator [Zavarzinella sp.]